MAPEAKPEAVAPADDGTAAQQLTALPGGGEKLAMRLVAAGFGSLAALADASPEALQEVEGIGPKSAEKILLAARAALGEAGVVGLDQGEPAEAGSATKEPAKEAE
jgi:N utilization substance protein A